jgi:hypothetical protein
MPACGLLESGEGRRAVHAHMAGHLTTPYVPEACGEERCSWEWGLGTRGLRVAWDMLGIPQISLLSLCGMLGPCQSRYQGAGAYHSPGHRNMRPSKPEESGWVSHGDPWILPH